MFMKVLKTVCYREKGRDNSGRYRFYRVNKNHDETPYNRDKTPLRLQKIAVHDNRHRIQIFFQLRFMKIIFLVHI